MRFILSLRINLSIFYTLPKLPQITLNEGNNTLMVNVRDPNGQPDNNNANNSDTFVIVVNNERDRIPLRQNFEQDFAPGWTVVSAERPPNKMATFFFLDM